MVILPETQEDYQEIGRLTALCFERDKESTLVERLRKSPGFEPGLSLTAKMDGELAGHVLFHPVGIRARDGVLHGSLALAPLSVHPGFRRRGIGARLVEVGLELARRQGYRSAIVLGDPLYYQRFGFEAAGKWGIKAPFDAPEEAFMALELVERGLQGVRGVVEYPAEFDDL